MKKLVSIFFAVVVLTTNLKAEAFIVMSGDDQRIIASKNMHNIQSVASISKIMSAIIAIENSALDKSFRVGDEILSANGSSIYLKINKVYKMETLLYGLLLRSGNDAANTIAVNVAGSIQDFVGMMNIKASNIGMLNTVFKNPSGLDEVDGGNLSTPYDMALLMNYAMKNETFMKICGSKYYTSEHNIRMKNKNSLLFKYQYCNGGKTGYTKKAGRTLVTCANNKKTKSIVVSFRKNDDFRFHQDMHENVFNNYHLLNVMNKGKYQFSNIVINAKKDVLILVSNKQNEKIATHSYTENNEFVFEVSVNGRMIENRYLIKQKHLKSRFMR